jgi:hypothetical protein
MKMMLTGRSSGKISIQTACDTVELRRKGKMGEAKRRGTYEQRVNAAEFKEGLKAIAEKRRKDQIAKEYKEYLAKLSPEDRKKEIQSRMFLANLLANFPNWTHQP